MWCRLSSISTNGDGLGHNSMKILYLLADLRSVGPTRQTLNIIKYSGVKDSCLVLTMFDEPPETLIGLYRDAGINVECLHLHRQAFVFNAVRKIAAFCTEKNIDVIHTYGVKPDIVAHFVSKKTGIKHIITLRNFPMEDLTGRMNPWAGKVVAHLHLFALKRCENLVACSETIARKMRERYGVEITPIQNGVDTSVFKKSKSPILNNPYSELGIDGKSVIFICTNSFIPRKHNDEIAEAFLKADLENAHLFFLGDGFLLKNTIAKYAAFPNIHFLGKKKDVVPFLQHANIFVSASDSEGLPNAVLEAIACGCFVMLSDIPQHREIIDILRSCGLLFSLRQVDTICSKMQEMAKQINEFDVKDFLEESPFTMEKMGVSYGRYYGEIKC